MASPEKVWSPVSPTNRWQEIPKSEFAEYHARLMETLEAVCASAAFRTSPKSCEFLRHIVLRSIEGETDVLKERLIGMALLGRDASYDTSTDAGVRVRANDVRKRLNAHNRGLGSEAEICFGLPAGTYIPILYRSAADEPTQEPGPLQVREPAPRLPLYELAVPTLAALFLCVICMRWQFAQAHSFTRFWDRVLPDNTALLCLPPSQADGGQDLIAIRELKLASPLLDLAGQLHRRFTLISTPVQFTAPGGMLVYVGAGAVDAGQPDTLAGLPDAAAVGALSRFVVEDTPSGRKILDRQPRNGPGSTGGRGALLTIVNGSQHLIWIDGTDDASIRMMVDRLCDQSAFPASLADSFQPNTITQAVFPSVPREEPILTRIPLRKMQAALEP